MNNQCNLLHSLAFFTVFQLKILETSIEKPEGGRVQKNSSNGGNTISPHLFTFSEMPLNLQIPKVYTAIERLKWSLIMPNFCGIQVYSLVGQSSKGKQST